MVAKQLLEIESESMKVADLANDLWQEADMLYSGQHELIRRGVQNSPNVSMVQRAFRLAAGAKMFDIALKDPQEFFKALKAIAAGKKATWK